MENKTRYNVVYQTHQGEEWIVASFMNWYDAMEYIERQVKNKVVNPTTKS